MAAKNLDNCSTKFCTVPRRCQYQPVLGSIAAVANRVRLLSPEVNANFLGLNGEGGGHGLCALCGSSSDCLCCKCYSILFRARHTAFPPPSTSPPFLDLLLSKLQVNTQSHRIAALSLVFIEHLPVFTADVACGKEHCMLLTEYGQVYTWGGGTRQDTSYSITFVALF